MSTILQRRSGQPQQQFQVNASAIASAIKPTGRTELPAERCRGMIIPGYLLFPDLVTPVPMGSLMPPSSQVLPMSPPAAAPPAAAPAAEAPAPAKQELIPPAAKVTLESLRAAVELTRGHAKELGAELYIDPDGVLRAKVTLEI